MTARVHERQSRIRERGHLLPPAQALESLVTAVLGAPAVPTGEHPPPRVEIPGPELADFDARDGAAGCADPVREVAYLGVLQADVEGGQVVFRQLFDGDAAAPGSSVGFGLAG